MFCQCLKDCSPGRCSYTDVDSKAAAGAHHPKCTNTGGGRKRRQDAPLAGEHRLPVVTAGDQIHSLPLQEQSQLRQGSAVQDRNTAGRGSRASIAPSARGLQHSHCQGPGAHCRACPNVDTDISKLHLATRNLHGWKCPPP